MTLRLAPKSKEYGFRLGCSDPDEFWWLDKVCIFGPRSTEKGQTRCMQVAACLLQAELHRQDYKAHHLAGKEFAEAYAQKHLWRAQAKLFEVK